MRRIESPAVGGPTEIRFMVRAKTYELLVDAIFDRARSLFFPRPPPSDFLEQCHVRISPSYEVKDGAGNSSVEEWEADVEWRT